MVRVGIIGAGYWGPNLIRNFVQLEKAHVVYCCDLDAGKRARIAKQYPHIQTTADARDLFDDDSLNAVVIATPTNTHAQLARSAIQAGKHVLVEKPLTLSVDDAKKLVTLAKRNNRVIMVSHTYEYNPAVEWMRDYIKSGELGDIYYVYGVRVNLGKVREETNALWNLAPHDFSILRFLFKNNPQAVSAFGSSFLQKAHEDVVFINLRFPKNIIAHIQVSWLDPAKKRTMTLIGSKKMLVFDDLDNESPIRIYDKGMIRLVDDRGQRIFGEFSMKLRPGDIVLPYIKPEESLKKECVHFIDCIQNNKIPRSDGFVGLEVVKMLDAAQKSLDQNSRWISIS